MNARTGAAIIEGDRAPVRVMVVDDSAVVRSLVAHWIDCEDGLTTVARHANGRLAVEAIAAIAPDVIVLDIEMPVMDGLTALPLLRSACPGARIVVLSTLTQRNAEISMRALALGAADYVPKPSSDGAASGAFAFRDELVRKVRALGRKPAARRAARDAGAWLLTPFSSVPPAIVAIGSSTGGPQALATVLTAARGALDHRPTVVVQHMPPSITAMLAQHLSRITGRPAKEAEDGEPLRPGVIYVAPGGRHMIVSNGEGAVPTVGLHDGPELHFCRPAVDLLFASVAKAYGPAALAIVLTGMGQDGAKGVRRVAEAGGSAVAQDEASSVVWGMPGAAVATGKCAAILPVDRIGQKISALCGGVSP